MDKPTLQAGQRWLWKDRLLAEIVSEYRTDGNYPINAKVIGFIRHGRCFAALGQKFKIYPNSSNWEYLSGQDAP
jgi:hypothetical protein